MLNLFTLKSNSSSSNTGHNHRTVWSVRQNQIYQQYFTFFKIPSYPPSILRKAKDASESSKNVFLLRFSRIKHFRDTILLKFFLLTISPKLANFELGEYFHSPKSTVDAKYINSSFFVEIHALTAQLSLFQSNF